MYLAFHATHDPRQSPKEYIDMYPFAKKKLRLYNVKKDPHEMNDLSDDPEYVELIARMDFSFKALQQAMGDSFGCLSTWRP
jgi:arylsulfatase A-like enzyme